MRNTRLAAAVASMLAVLVLAPTASRAAEQLDCTTVPTRKSCGFTVRVGDPTNPCIERDGKAYCPVTRYYYPESE